MVVWHFSSGGSGNFTAVDAIYSQSSGVVATVTDGTNCIASYRFIGKTTPPSSITCYGQNYGTNTFNMKDTTSLPTATMLGGGTAASPNIVNGIIDATTTVSLQTRLGDVGASAGLGQRAWLVIVFGF
jgi:hypothetical protein